ncbi:hypothetical protein [Candidatus Williamhamiltonella defendens]|uniref:hypothetical protein n=1 Tax=Candidatus Williamhamiltonella defendens TaxID=138072 RepID=UPI0016518659|nr:hypothetical protein [Candidatus Hamiltonella defensa]
MNYIVVLLSFICIIVICAVGLLTNNKEDKKDLITNTTNVISENKVFGLLVKAKKRWRL